MTNMDQVQQEESGRPLTLKDQHVPSKDSSTHHPNHQETPNQGAMLTKVLPSSPKKTVVTNGKMKLVEVNPYLTCLLCKGYLIDATTISECLHSFCRSCIIQFLQDKSHCPECEVVINKAKPNLKLDKTLQDIVYKLVPSLYVNEMTRRRKFYAERPTAVTSHLAPEQRGDDTERIIFNASDKFSLSLEYASDDIGSGGILMTIKKEDPDEESGIVVFHNNNNDNDKTNLESTIPPECANVMRRYLQCPGMCRIDVLKKFVRSKYNVDTNRFHIDILYKRVPLPDHYTLIDIAYIYSWKRNEPMKFFFRITDHKLVRERFDFYDEENPVIPKPRKPEDLDKITITSSTELETEPPVIKKPVKTVRFHSDTLKLPIATSTPIKPKSDKVKEKIKEKLKDKMKDKLKIKFKKPKVKKSLNKVHRAEDSKLSENLHEAISVMTLVSDNLDTSIDKDIKDKRNSPLRIPDSENLSEKEQFLKSIQLLSTREVDQHKILNQNQRKPQNQCLQLSPSNTSSSGNGLTLKNILKISQNHQQHQNHSNSFSYKRKVSSPLDNHSGSSPDKSVYDFEESPKLKKRKLVTKKHVTSPKSSKKINGSLGAVLNNISKNLAKSSLQNEILSKSNSNSVASLNLSKATVAPVSSSVVSTTTTTKSPGDKNQQTIPEPNLKNLLTTCKIPSSLSITCVNGQERETKMNPVINHIEILKLPEVTTSTPREQKDRDTNSDSSKKESPQVPNESKTKMSSTNQEKQKLEKVGTTMQLQSSENDPSSNESTKVNVSNDNKSQGSEADKVSITITMEDKPNQNAPVVNGQNANSVGVHPNLPRIIQPAAPTRPITSFQKMFEETLSNPPTTPAFKFRTKSKTASDPPSEKKPKKVKVETPPVSSSSPSSTKPPELPTGLVTNAEGKVAIPRLKKAVQAKLETLSNLHSNMLSMNYSVSVNQNQTPKSGNSVSVNSNQTPKSGNSVSVNPNQTPKSVGPREEHVVSSTTLKQLELEAQRMRPIYFNLKNLPVPVGMKNKDGKGSKGAPPIIPKGIPPLVNCSAPIKVEKGESNQNNNLSVPLSVTVPKPTFKVKPAPPPLKKAAPTKVLSGPSSSSKSNSNSTTPMQNKNYKPNILKQPSPKMGTTPPIINSPKPNPKSPSPIPKSSLPNQSPLPNPKSPLPIPKSPSPTPKGSSPTPKIDVNQLQEKYNLQNLAQLSASFNFPTAFNPHQPNNPFAALQRAMLLNQLHQQQQNNWYNMTPANLVQYEKFIKSLGTNTGNGTNGGHLLGKDN